METTKFNKVFQNCIKLVFSCLFSWIFLNVLFVTTPTVAQPNAVKSFVWLLLCIAGCVVLYRVITYQQKQETKVFLFCKKKEKLLLLLLIAVTATLEFGFVYFSFQRTGWDAEYLFTSAWKLAKSLIGKDFWTYYYMYPNNTFLLACETLFIKVVLKIEPAMSGTLVYYLLLCINVIVVNATLICTYSLAKTFWGKKWAWITLIGGILLLGLNPWLTVFYSDILAMIFPVLFLWLLLKFKQAKFVWVKSLLLVSGGVCLAVGMSIKPTVVIVGIAVFVLAVVYSLSRRRQKAKRLLVVFLSCCILLAGFIIGRAVVQKFTIFLLSPYGWDIKGDQDLQFPWTHFLMMGATENEIWPGTNYYGAWDIDTVVYTQSFKGYEQKEKANIEGYLDQVKSYGVFGYLDFLNHKMNWVLGDGSFFWGREGVFYRGITRSMAEKQGALGRWMKDVLYLGSAKNECFSEFQQGLWLGYLFLLAVSGWVKDEKEQKNFINVLKLTIMGIVFFLLLFEGRSRYLILYLPFFLLLAIAVQREFLEKMGRYRKSHGNNKKNYFGAM